MYSPSLELDTYTQTQHRHDIYIGTSRRLGALLGNRLPFYTRFIVQYYRKDTYPCTRLNLSTRGEAAITIDRAQNTERVQLQGSAKGSRPERIVDKWL
jgi:hypothetical protein